MEIVKCENEKCKNGIISWIEEREIFVCDVCGALYR